MADEYIPPRGNRLAGKVAIVTGSGRGIGRAHAIALAAEGAMVVVNDPGVERTGAGGSAAPADDTVAFIRENGGEAVANYNSVADYEEAGQIVRTALDAYGRLDILVNNAGIAREGLFHRITPEDFAAVVGTHLKGTFNTCHHAVPLLMEQRSGRIVNTASSQWRNPEGRAAYGAAKGGIVSLTWDLAFELRYHNVTVNAIAPMAQTRGFVNYRHPEALAEAGIPAKKAGDELAANRPGGEHVLAHRGLARERRRVPRHRLRLPRGERQVRLLRPPHRGADGQQGLAREGQVDDGRGGQDTAEQPAVRRLGRPVHPGLERTPPSMPDLPLVIGSAVTVLFASTIQGATGFGFVVTSSPIMASYLDPKLVIPVLMILGTVLNLPLMVHTRREFSIARIWPMTLAGVACTPIGTFILTRLDAAPDQDHPGGGDRNGGRGPPPRVAAHGAQPAPRLDTGRRGERAAHGGRRGSRALQSSSSSRTRALSSAASERISSIIWLGCRSPRSRATPWRACSRSNRCSWRRRSCPRALRASSPGYGSQAAYRRRCSAASRWV